MGRSPRRIPSAKHPPGYPAAHIGEQNRIISTALNSRSRLEAEDVPFRGSRVDMRAVRIPE